LIGTGPVSTVTSFLETFRMNYFGLEVWQSVVIVAGGVGSFNEAVSGVLAAYALTD
jgi:hypothetical protein